MIDSGIKGPMDFSKERSLTYLRAVAQLQFDELARLREENTLLREKAGVVAGLEEDNAVLKELLERREHTIFGRSSERRGGEPRAKTGEGKPQTGHGHREQPDLEREIMVHDLPENERGCPCCGGDLEAMAGEVESSELVSLRERGFVIEVHERKKYRCRCNGAVVTAPGPQRLVRGGRYSISFAVEMAQSQCTNRDDAPAKSRRYDRYRRSTRPARRRRRAHGQGLDRGRRLRLSSQAPMPPRPRAGRQGPHGRACPAHSGKTFSGC